MVQNSLTQQTNNLHLENGVDDGLITWIEAFLIDRKAQNLTHGTVRYYREKLSLFLKYCDSQLITRIGQITPDTIRRFLLWLEETKHNPGGVHSAFRSLRAFLLWFENEMEPDGWRNPIRKVKAPKVPENIIDPVEIETVKAMIEVCTGSKLTAVRDRALLLFLLDTGIRAQELLALNLSDIDQVNGSVQIMHGKGRKPRTVYLQQKARRALRAYLKRRNDKEPAAWISKHGQRLKYGGLRQVFEDRAQQAQVKVPSAHDFRRAFALNMLRNGVDLITLSRLMGHSGLTVLKKYLKQANIDLQAAHAKGSPVDHGGF